MGNTAGGDNDHSNDGMYPRIVLGRNEPVDTSNRVVKALNASREFERTARFVIHSLKAQMDERMLTERQPTKVATRKAYPIAVVGVSQRLANGTRSVPATFEW